MKRKTIRNVILLATISILGIVITQFYWINKAWDIKEKLFNHTVNVSLRNVANEILLLRGDSAAYIEPIKQAAANYFIVSINDTLHPYLLESLLKAEFESRNLAIDFEYGIYDCFTDSMLYGNYVSLNKESTAKKSSTTLPVKWEGDAHYFGVYFPNKDNYLVSQMGIWVFSSVILLIVIIFFSYTMVIILKQKRLSEITTDFINNMTHEFKTPISTISLSSEVLMKPGIVESPSRLQRYAEIIYDENNRLKNMVERLLQMATLDQADFNLNKKETDLNLIIKQSIQHFTLALNEKNGKLIFHPPSESRSILADKVHLSNILSNLIDNAIKYSNENMVINISLENLKKGVLVCVKDNGMGMNKEVQKQVFNKFYRVPTGNLHNIKGFGLGLNYVKIMVEAHKGKITLESELGKGSTFKVFLPYN